VLSLCNIATSLTEWDLELSRGDYEDCCLLRLDLSSLVDTYRRFEGTYGLYLRERRCRERMLPKYWYLRTSQETITFTVPLVMTSNINHRWKVRYYISRKFAICKRHWCGYGSDINTITKIRTRSSDEKDNIYTILVRNSHGRIPVGRQMWLEDNTNVYFKGRGGWDLLWCHRCWNFGLCRRVWRCYSPNCAVASCSRDDPVCLFVNVIFTNRWCEHSFLTCTVTQCGLTRLSAL
jgi:hypothetical protein